MYKIFVNTLILGSKIIYLPKCHSTNDHAAELFEKGIINNGGIVITDDQNKGRGQRGNIWESSPGKNLTFSVVLTPLNLPIENSFYLNIISSLAIQTAFDILLPDLIKVKWPNDIYYNESKAGGILIENIIQSRSIMRSIIGFGLNINQLRFPSTYNAISLGKILKKEIDLNDILNNVVKQIDHYYDLLNKGEYGFLKEVYLQELFWKDEKHLFKAKEIFEGIIRDIDKDGRLIIETNTGLRKFNFKEVAHLQ